MGHLSLYISHLNSVTNFNILSPLNIMNRFTLEHRWDLLEISLIGNCTKMSYKFWSQCPVYSNFVKLVFVVHTRWRERTHTRKYRSSDWECTRKSISINLSSFLRIVHPPNIFYFFWENALKNTTKYFLKFLFLFESTILPVSNEK